MSFIVSTVLLALGLVVGMGTSMEVGYRLGLRQQKQNPDAPIAENGPVDSTVFAILGLILAFTFTGAIGRYDNRRELIAKEANAIGTAYLRLDLLPPEAQAQLRPIYRDYLRQRIELPKSLEQMDVAQAIFQSTLDLQSQIWQISTQEVLIQRDPINSLVVAATNDLIDVTNERLQASRMHPPAVVYYLMYVLALAASLLTGFNMSGHKKRSYLHGFLFCSLISATIYITIELEDPRRGLMRINTGDKILVELLDSIEP